MTSTRRADDDVVQLPTTALKSIGVTTTVIEQMVSHLQTLNSNLERLLVDNDHIARTASAMHAHQEHQQQQNEHHEQQQQQSDQ